MGVKQKNVFISHIHKDDSGLSDLKELLGKNQMKVSDYSITSDKENNAKSPEYIKNQILSPRIAACSTLIVYITKATKQSEWVDWEIQKAFQLDKTVVGVWERGSLGCEIPKSLKEYDVPIVGWQGQSIIDAINGTCTDRVDPNRKPLDKPLPVKPHPC